MLKRVLMMLSILVLSGCAGVNIDNFNDAKIKGNSFTTALVKDYKSFVDSEARQYDWVSADHFAQKGMKALNGENIGPENPDDWSLPHANVAEFTNYFHRLSYILDNGAKKSSPILAARALAKYDCWVEQQSENHQPNDINACRGEFLKAFGALEKAEPKLAAAAKKHAASKPKAKSKSDAVKSADGVIYFDFNAANLSADDVAEIKQIAKNAGKKSKVKVSGHTDTAGSAALNKALSHRRAAAVRQALIAAGVPSKNIRLEARGESDLAVQTGDNVREAKNRRVVIRVE